MRGVIEYIRIGAIAAVFEIYSVGRSEGEGLLFPNIYNENDQICLRGEKYIPKLSQGAKSRMKLLFRHQYPSYN